MSVPLPQTNPTPAGSRALRICHLGKYAPPHRGGIETHVRELARAQADLGHRISIVCLDPRPGRGGSVRRSGEGGVSILAAPVLLRIGAFDAAPSVLGLVRTLGREADVLHLHAPNPLMTLAVLAGPPRGALVVTHHSDVVRQKVLGRLFEPIEDALYSRADLLLATSDAYVGGSRLLTRHLRKVRSLPLGIDLRRFGAPSAATTSALGRLLAGREEPLWLCVGRLVHYKGIDVALRALADCPGTLLISGKGPLETPLRRLAGELGVDRRVVWSGELEDEVLAAAVRRAAALWFPSTSRAEGFGLVQVEAMAAGCPVINTRIPDSGVSWVSPDGETGLTVAPGSPTELAAAARRLAGDAALRAKLGAAGRARAARDFDADLMARRSVSAYLGLRREPSGP